MPTPAIIAAALAALCAVAPARPLADSFHTYHGARVPLPLDPTRIAVFQSPDQLAAESSLRALGLPELGIAAADIAAHPIAGWSLIALPAQADAPAFAAAALNALAARPDVRFVSPVYLDSLGGPLLITADFFVAFNANTSRRDAERTLAALPSATILDRDYSNLPNVYRLRAASARGDELLASINSLAALPSVRFAEPDAIFTGRGEFTPNDPFFSQCWGLHNTGQTGGLPDMDMDAPEAWDTTSGSSTQRIVVIDTGVDQTHPDINQVPGIDFTTNMGNGGPVNEFDNHGTPVAGCISERMNNGIGGCGVAPNTRAASARTFIAVNANGGWTTQTSWTVSSLNWAQTTGARVTNNSNLYGFTSNLIDNKYNATRAAGIVHFACAGNDAAATIGYPSSIPVVISVAALDEFGNLTSFSNHGPGLDLSAPGIRIVSTDRQGTAGYSASPTNGDYTSVSGTSFASPYSAGVAALVLSKNPYLGSAAVEQILQTSAVDLGALGYDTTFGWGFVNANIALMATPPPCPGDADGNYVVNFLDLNTVLSFYGAIGQGTPGDLNGDGAVDFLDLNLVLSYYGGAC